VAHILDHIAQCGGVPGHFQAHVEAFFHAQLLLHVLEGAPALHVERDGGAHLPRQVKR